MRQLACAVVRDPEGRVLLGLREDFDVWGLPGGHVEPGETPDEAARREVREELGVEVDVEGLIGRYTRLGGVADAQSYAYAACLVDGEAVPDGIETLDVGWFDAASLPPMLWWNKLPILDHVAGRREVEREFEVEFRFGHMSRGDLYALRDASSLTRREFYLDAFPEPDLALLLASRT